MRRFALIAALAGLCAASTASLNYKPVINEPESITAQSMGLPEGVEIEKIEPEEKSKRVSEEVCKKKRNQNSFNSYNWNRP